VPAETEVTVKHGRFQTNPTCRGLRRHVLTLILALSVLTALPAARAQTVPRPPDLFTYDELVRLYEQEPLPDALRRKLERLRTTPFASNAAAARGVRPLKPDPQQLGRVLRVAAWNIERGLNFDAVRAALLGPEAFARLLDRKKYPPRSDERVNILRQSILLSRADVIVINEADLGARRTSYRDVARELAAALAMNYAWGLEFVDQFSPTDLPIKSQTAAGEIGSQHWCGLKV
jgi:hypothetical protein